MSANFFAGFQTVVEIKTRYRELARQFHPDLGGCLENHEGNQLRVSRPPKRRKRQRV